MRGIALPTPIAGQDTHDANKQSSYQVTDDGPGNGRGTPDPRRQVNAKAVSQSQHESDRAGRSEQS